MDEIGDLEEKESKILCKVLGPITTPDSETTNDFIRRFSDKGKVEVLWTHSQNADGRLAKQIFNDNYKSRNVNQLTAIKTVHAGNWNNS